MTMMDNPTQMSRFEIVAWSILVGVIIGWFFRGAVMSPTDRPIAVGSPRVEVMVVHDTIIQSRPQIVVRDAPARVRVERVPVVVYVDSSTHDTLVARPFQARADTIVGRDTIEQRFDFPPPRLSVLVRQGPDSVITTRETITVTAEVDRPRPWYEEPAKAILWMGLGYGLRVLTAPSK
jgi:hypothetical protein